LINLFNLNSYTIDLGSFDHHLHGSIVTEFEKEFCDYVGAKHGCALSSATNAIFLSLLNKDTTVDIPTLIPPVVANAITNSGNKVSFTDNTFWVGSSYYLHHFEDYSIIDSAQRVSRNQFKEHSPHDLMFFSFYPTKPVGGIDGGIIVSDDEDKINWFREASMNGMSYSLHNWDRELKFPGWKMYMNSAQAYVALQNLRKLDEKKERLADIRLKYNRAFGQLNKSDHLYRLNVKDRATVRHNLKEEGIITGIHYEPLHKSDVYGTDQNLKWSEQEAASTISIPFHEGLTDGEVDKVIHELKQTSVR
tara:strand:+ start:9123 stop:10040 length:918 start_codon:yes stop_codon:yes gene_type:complete